MNFLSVNHASSLLLVLSILDDQIGVFENDEDIEIDEAPDLPRTWLALGECRVMLMAGMLWCGSKALMMSWLSGGR